MSLWSRTCQYCQQARWLIMAVLTLIFIAWGVWGWREVADWYQDTSPVMAFGQGIAAQDAVRPGDVLIVHQPVVKLRDCEGFTRNMVTGPCGHKVVNESPTTLVKGFDGRLTIPVQVPSHAIPGPCSVQIQAVYACNPFDSLLKRRQTFLSPPIPFIVKEFGYP